METFCSYCNVLTVSEAELKVHYNSQSHQLTIMSDEGKVWVHRAPPRGVGAEEYAVCPMFSVSGKCRFGRLCCDAHGENELTEWKERFNYRQMKLQRAKECCLQGTSYIEQILEKWFSSTNPNLVMREKLDGVEITVYPDLNITISQKNCAHDWTFRISSKANLCHVALLYETHRNHFVLSELTFCESGKSPKDFLVGQQCQEWTNTDSFLENSIRNYTCKVNFVTSIYGTFRQAVVFDFGSEPALVQKLSVDVVSVTDLEKLQQAREDVVSFTERWSIDDVRLVPFRNKPYALSENEESLLSYYPAPSGEKFTVTQSVMEPSTTASNYGPRQHELLYIEEMAQYDLLSRYNVQAPLHLVSCYLLTPNSASTAKYVHFGELFAKMELSSVLSEDSAPGRLVLTNCNTVLIAPVKTKGDINRKVYEAVIEDKGKTVIYIRLSDKCVQELGLQADTEMTSEVQFQLNRLPLCEMHFAIDKLFPTSLVFPHLSVESTSICQYDSWNSTLDPRLNPKQKEAVMAITSPLCMKLPPILIIGPFGTGKTFTLAQAVKCILNDPLSRVLVCTHSNSAADIYIREYLHPHVTEGHIEATPLRIYYRHRWVATVHPTVQEYCLISISANHKFFNMPTIEDVKKHRVIVTTLSISRYLVQLGLEKGFFTHILVDEAAQAMECEAIMPLSLANDKTRIVLAGDHMQLSPEVYSQFAQERNLHTSLLERLFDLYPEQYCCKILLCENYRSHEAIIQYTSELFYDNNLLASGKQPRHDAYFPLTFFTARGEDVQDLNSTAFHNNAEVYEIVERVIELKKSWPAVWGEQDETSIGVVTPYYDQVVRIRSELRKKKLHGVSVERVLNVQGKQFRAIFLSAVRTRQTCSALTGKLKSPESELDHGFLSNARLLNTAITRAQSLVAVVGDPISLCSVGKCRKLWEKFIHTCHTERSLFGITWDSLRSQLDGMELKKNFVLNPLAPEFVPGRLYHGQPYTPPPRDFLCRNPPVPTQPLLLFPHPRAFQGPPILLPHAARMLSSNHPFNLSQPYLGPPLMVPQSSFPKYPFTPVPRTPTVHPRLSPSINARRFGNIRFPVMNSEQGLMKDDHSIVSRQVKRNDGPSVFNSTHKQAVFRSIDENDLNHSECEEQKKALGCIELNGNISTLPETSESVASFRSSQGGLCLSDENELKVNHPKPENGISFPVRYNVTNHPSTPQDHNNAFIDHEMRTGVKPCFMNGTYNSLVNKSLSEPERCEMTNMHFSEGAFHQSIDSCLPQSTPNRLFPSNDVNGVSSIREIRERSLSNGQVLPPYPVVLHGNNGSNVGNKFHSINDVLSNMNRLEISQLSAIQSSLHEKLQLLERILPPGTDLKNFLNSVPMHKAFHDHLMVTEGSIVAERFVNLMTAIKRDQEYLSRNQPVSNVVEREQWSKYNLFPPKNISESPAVPTIRNIHGIPFYRSEVTDNVHSEGAHVFKPFGIEPVAPRGVPQNFTPEKIEHSLFLLEEKQQYNKQSSSINQSLKNDFGSIGENIFEKTHTQLPVEYFKALSLNRSENMECRARNDGVDFNTVDFIKRSENELKRLSFENNKQLWAPVPPVQNDNSSLGIFSNESYLSKLRSISNDVVANINGKTPPFSKMRPITKALPTKQEHEVPINVTAGPLSTSYPDIPDVIASRVFPQVEDISPKVIRKPTPSHTPTEQTLSNFQHTSPFLLGLTHTDSSSSLGYPHVSHEGMTYAKIVRSPQP